MVALPGRPCPPGNAVRTGRLCGHFCDVTLLANPLQVSATTPGEGITQYGIQRGLSLNKFAKELGIGLLKSEKCRRCHRW